MKKSLLFVAIVFFISGSLSAQVAINTTGDEADPSAILDLQSTTKGFLVPRVTSAQRNLIGTTQSGLLVYDLTTESFWYYDNTQAGWVDMGNGTGVSSIDDLSDAASDDNSVFLGKFSGVSNDGTNNNNTGVGVYSLFTVTGGANNVAVGWSSLGYNSSGSNNCAIGFEAAYRNQSGYSNVAIGNKSLFSNTTRSNLVAIGDSALYNNGTGATFIWQSTNNTAVGSKALRTNRTGSGNTAMGYTTLYLNTTGYNNTANGVLSLQSNSTGYSNTAIGAYSMEDNSYGNSNVAVGESTLEYNISGSNNTALGFMAGRGQLGSSYSGCVFLGNNAGYNNLSDNQLYIDNSNTDTPLIGGDFASNRVDINGTIKITGGTPGLNKVLTSDANGLASWEAPASTVTSLDDLTDAQNSNTSIFIGDNAGASDDGGNYNIAVGTESLALTTSGIRNISVGTYANGKNTTGNNNITLGYGTLRNNITGSNNTAIGDGAGWGLYNNSSVNGCVLIGYQAGYNNVSDNKLYIDNSNTSTPLIGGDFSTNQVDINGTIKITGGSPGANKVLTSDATGLASWVTPTSYASSINDLTDAIYDNTSLYLGYLSGANDDGGNYNLGIGREALTTLTTGLHNTALGYKALATCNADDNTAVGINALRYTTSGTQNTSMGMNALQSNTTGSFNTGVGYETLKTNTEGHVNSAFGISALIANTTGSFNSAFGYLALGDNTVGLGNTAMGYGALSSNTTGTYNTAVGYGSYVASASYSNSIALGYLAPVNGNNQIHLGNTSITEIKGQVSFTTYSDGRIKDNVNEDVIGLDFIMKLRPVTYNINLDKENQLLGISDKVNLPNKYDIEKVKKTGFIAQEVEAAANEVDFDFSGIQSPKNEHDLYGLSYAEFVVPLVKSVQELNQKLEKENAELKARIEKLEQLLIK